MSRKHHEDDNDDILNDDNEEELSKKEVAISMRAETAARERTKLENRTRWLQASMAFNVAIIAGLTVHFLGRCQ